MRRAMGTRPANSKQAGIALILLMASVLVSLSAPPAGARQAQGPSTLELPAMVMTPADLAESGMPGYRLTGGEIGSTSDLAGIAGDWTDQVTNDDIQATLEGFGLLRSYKLGLRVTQDPTDIRSDVSRDLIASVHEFGDAAGATQGLALLDQLSAAFSGIQRVEGAGPITSNAVLVRVPPTDPADPVADMSIAFQVDRIIAVIDVIDYLNQEPTSDEIETLAMLLSERIEAGLAGDTPGLGNMALRLKDVEFDGLFEIRLDEYQRRDGEDFAYFLQDDTAFTRQTAAAGEAVDAYAFNQFVQDTDSIDPSLPFQFAWVSRIYRFANEQAASAWIAARPDQIQSISDDPIQDLQETAGASIFGDESVSVTYVEGGDSPSKIYRTFLRVGDRTADIYLNSSTSDPFPDTTIQAFAGVQAQCLGTGCPEPVLITDALDGEITVAEPQNVPATPAAQVQALADLASMALTPTDLAALQLPDFGVGLAYTTYPDEWLQSVVEYRGVPEAQVQAAVGPAGFVRRYDNFLDHPADPGDPSGAIGQTVVSYIIEFSSETGAGSVFAFLEDESTNPQAEDLSLAAPIGDQAEATHLSGQDPNTGAAYDQIDLTFQVGRYHAGVAVIDWQGQPVDLRQVEPLALRLLERFSATDLARPGLSNLVLRVAGEAATTVRDDYLLLGGSAIAQYGESSQDAQQREAGTAEYAQTDIYRVQQQLSGGTQGTTDDVGAQFDLTRFSTEDAAIAWMTGVPQRISTDDRFANVHFGPGLPLGDESLAYTLTSSDGTVAYRSVAIRVGTLVATLDITGASYPPLLLLVALADAQAQCLNNGGCPEPFVLPGGIS